MPLFPAISAFGASLLSAASAAVARTTLGVNVWTAVADTNYTVLVTDKIIGYTSITASRTVTLPAASAINAGQELIIGDVSGSVTSAITITIARAGSDTINGATSYTISTPRGLVRLVSDGSSKWYFDIVGPPRGGVMFPGRLSSGGTVQPSVPGSDITTVSTIAIAANIVRYAPILVESQITIDQLGLEVTTAGAASTTARLGLYTADSAWVPTSLVIDGGTVAVDSTGFKSVSISQVLAPGRYATALNSDGTPTLRFLRGGSRLMGINATMGASTYATYPTNITQTYGAFPSTATALTALGGGSNPPVHFITIRVNTIP